MLHPHVTLLAERQMTARRITEQAAAAASPPGEPAPAGQVPPRRRYPKLSPVQARQVRQMYQARQHTVAVIARLAGVSRRTVYRVVTPHRPTCPPVVCLCGSTRFVDEFNRQRGRLTRDGQIVLSIEIVTTQTRAEDPQHADPALKARLDELHLRKIDLADYILVLNVGGYTGPSTQAEIRYARAAGKPVRYLEPPGPGPGEWACRACGDAWFGTPSEDELCPQCPAVAR